MTDFERRLAPYFERAEPRQRAMTYLRGLLSPAERKNSWQLAEVSGDTTPYAFQPLLRRTLWDPEAIRAVGPGRTADGPPHPGLVAVASWAPKRRPIFPRQASSGIS